MRWRVALMHPFGLALLVASALVASVVEVRAPWSGRPIWLFLWGILAYGASATVVLLRSRSFSGTSPPSDKVAPSQRNDFVQLTEEALRRLRRPADLGNCALIALLPCTLNSIRTPAGGQSPAQATPLEHAQALRQILVGTIEKLKPPQDDEVGTDQGVQYHILHEEYVVGRPNHAIMTRLSIGEGNFFRQRRDAIAAVAYELMVQEQRLSRDTTQTR